MFVLLSVVVSILIMSLFASIYFKIRGYEDARYILISFWLMS